MILTCLVCLFAGAGMLAFGQQMEEFHSFPLSVISTMIVMTTGSAHYYPTQYEIDPVFACLWHWMLMTTMWVVCLNIILCILVDSYAEAKAKMLEEEDAYEGAMPSLVDQSLVTATSVIDSLRQTTTNIRVTNTKMRKQIVPMPTVPQGHSTQTEELEGMLP